ncbi:uncharacterized protein LOC128681267 [Plodia interpunctella]|uniref:uncharacterized protein LOC128681267 n=1 Tax=Plodia interpunctella TaxID=58824 RepID=UPI002367FE97|nr:uncharacterized protein LOC128681267 [Plodia interpunctella]
MTLVLRKYLIPKNKSFTYNLCNVFRRTLSDNKGNDNPEFSNSTILVENGFNVQELPVVVRRWKNIEVEEEAIAPKGKHESISYQLIQSEFNQCLDLRDVFSLLSKCTKITPNIALGAMERIHYLENNPSITTGKESKNMHVNLAKGAILDKLIKVVIKTEDTQTILNVIQSTSTFLEPYKPKFSDELLFRTLDNKLNIEQICIFLAFLIENKTNTQYATTIDKLWVGFIQREGDINEENIGQLFSVLTGLKVSKRILLTLLEQKLSQLWDKIKVPVMLDILSAFIEEKYSSVQTFNVVGTWLHMNIHTLDEDSLLDIITKITRLNYTDDQIQKAVEKYMRLRGPKIKSHVIIVGILNYCMHFHIQSEQILKASAEYFIENSNCLPASFLKSFIYPFGFLSYPTKDRFWELAEDITYQKFYNISADNLSSIILSFLYVGKYPLKLVNRICSPEYLVKVKPDIYQKLHLIDTVLSLECDEYSGPLLPKDHWNQPLKQDNRVKNMVDKIMEYIIEMAGDGHKVSAAVLLPQFCSDETYLVDVMIYPVDLEINTPNWKSKSVKNEIKAVLIHLPDQYCSDNEQLVGPQMMRKKHLKILGMQVVSLKYSVLSQFYTSYNKHGLKQYLADSIHSSELC